MTRLKVLVAIGEVRLNINYVDTGESLDAIHGLVEGGKRWSSKRILFDNIIKLCNIVIESRIS